MTAAFHSHPRRRTAVQSTRKPRGESEPPKPPGLLEAVIEVTDADPPNEGAATHDATALDGATVLHGLPSAIGRWQPTRAGVLNSWKWADEEFHFAGGWLAFVGRNGSGKSLTASQLVTVLLDGDSSQTALSVSGRAAGTLMNRHTDNSDRDDKTGVWWLEYGRTDPITGETEYLTSGLWLRSSSQALLRAYFLVPGRVGKQLTLQVDRNVVGIDGLAEQLAATGGELFTDSNRLKPRAGAHLSAISAEGSYRNAVRIRLFDPLDQVQYDALISVLRTLRSVRTAEKISAREMLEVLDGALPALDQSKLSEIATAMQRIASLESQLADTKEQSKRLADTDRVYELYRRAITLTVAAALRSANTEFDNQTRQQRSAQEVLTRAESTAKHAWQALDELKFELARLEGELSASETALRDHAGAELPHREQRAQDMDTAAEAAERRAGQANAHATTASSAAEQVTQAARQAQQTMAKLGKELGSTAAAVHGDSVLPNLLAATSELARPDQLDPYSPETDIAVDELAATPLAWVNARERSIGKVSDALSELSTANHVAVDAADQQRAAQDDAEQCGAALEGRAAAREQVEQQLEDAILRWQKTAPLFPPVPDELFEPDLVDARVNPALLTSWLDQQTAGIRQRLDIPGHQARKNAADVTAEQAIQFAAGQRNTAAEVGIASADAQRRHDEQVRAAAAAAEQDSTTDRAAQAEHAQQLDAARQHRHVHLVQHLQQTQAALGAVTVWSRAVQRWRERLKHLDGRRLHSPQPLTGQIEQLLGELTAAVEPARGDARNPRWLTLTDSAVTLADRSLQTLAEYDDEQLRTALAESSQQTIGLLDRRMVDAERLVHELRTRMDAVADNLEQAHQAPAPPPEPAWRTRADGSPLWSLVDFNDGMAEDARNNLEGALFVSGLLDAVITPDGRARAGDSVLTGDQQATGLSLADLLTVERDAQVAPELVSAVLRSVAVDHAARTTVRTGVLTAAAPHGYQSRYIGATARERARVERIAELQAQFASLDAEHEAAKAALEERRTDLAEAVSERQALPPAATWRQRRTKAQQAQQAAGAADRQATEQQRQADSALQAVQSRLAEAQQAWQRALAVIDGEVRTATALATQANNAAAAAERSATEKGGLAEVAGHLLEEALTTQAFADEQRDQFPPLTALQDARAAEDQATQELTAAQKLVQSTLTRVQGAQSRTIRALATLNQVADLGDGRMLPAEPAALKSFSGMLTQMKEQLGSWQRSTDRALQLRDQARTALTSVAELSERAREQASEATAARANAVREQAAVAQLRELYGAAYEELRLARQQAAGAITRAQERFDRLRDKGQQAAIDAASAKSTLEGIAPQRERAEQQREQCLQQMNRLVDESITTIDDGIGVDEVGRPANLTAALTWGARMLAVEPRGNSRDELAKLLEARRTRLETEAKTVSAALTRFDRQVTLQTIPGTDWRRAVVAAPDALTGEDLHLTVVALQETAAQLESDLRDDVKITLKTSMFAALRRDIATRRAAAQELVRQIRSTLSGVRTGVARVGVEVDWKVKNDPDAQRMIELVSALPSDETFEQMYEVLRQRLEEASGDTWEDRVAHTFDYRVWHEWDLKVTHSSFGDGTSEVFRPLTTRSNPLASLSTGEMRLATMLPLLAAAWSMYEAPGYGGPRLLFIDEVNAAFDPQNVRTLLGLLRAWNFDVLSTAPEMSAMLKAESERVVIAHMTHTGSVRVSMPWLWSGSGRPVLIADRISAGAHSAMAP